MQLDMVWRWAVAVAVTLSGLVVLAQAFKDGDVRLVGGRHEYDGTVLVLHQGRWGAICDEHWDSRDARVVCKQLGFPDAEAAVHRSRFGRGRRRHWLSWVRCRGHEAALTDCWSPPWGRVARRCRTTWASSAGVVCRRKAAPVTKPTTTPTTTTTTTATTTTTPTTTTTTTTPTTTTTIPTTTTTLPFKKPDNIPPAYHPKAQAITRADEQQPEDSTEVQADAPAFMNGLQLRIRGGRYPWEGRLEVREDNFGEWGTICGQDWTLRETMVACRELGQEHGKQPLQVNYFGGEKLTKHFAQIVCTGREERLDQCEKRRRVNGVPCPKAELVAGVVCSNYLPDLVPNLNELRTSVFVQDRPLYYLQCALEENCLANSAAVIRNTSSAWVSNIRRLLRFSTLVENRGYADFRPYRAKTQWQWHQCHMHYHSMEVFAHYDIIDDRGNRLAEGNKASFCLEDSTCDRGVQPKFNCVGFGDQGLSVNCSDNYMNDIDCQWIDITDVKPGSYTFMMEINPKLLVAELNFDNNIAVCDLQYTGYAAFFSNCHYESLL